MKIPRRIRFWWQRITRGWDDSDTWSLSTTIALFAYPRLKRFKELNNGHPCGMTSEQWDAEIDKMIYSMGMDIIERTDGKHGDIFKTLGIDEKRHDHDPEYMKECWKPWQDGLDSFGKYYNELWW